MYCNTHVANGCSKSSHIITPNMIRECAQSSDVMDSVNTLAFCSAGITNISGSNFITGKCSSSRADCTSGSLYKPAPSNNPRFIAEGMKKVLLTPFSTG